MNPTSRKPGEQAMTARSPMTAEMRQLRSKFASHKRWAGKHIREGGAAETEFWALRGGKRDEDQSDDQLP